MAKMSKESNLLVTFSKHHFGLFNKASELSTLCGVEVAIIIFSPGKKVFSFGHPCVEMAKMSKESNLLVTFSKHHSGISNKATLEELKQNIAKQANKLMIEASNLPPFLEGRK
ncbi:hypothetical protein L1049_003217 [Liquidambar formosana]|uniref:MADS-box domain-containing protein n=1 Tax=Liquidambar formosana TaxID=63359 RepID=A0AAP0NM59_LIQFO